MNDHDRKLNAETDSRTNRRPKPAGLSEGNLDGLARLRRDWSQMPMIPRIVLDRREGMDLSWPGFDIRTLLVGEESAGRFSFHDIILAPGAALPEHHLLGADTYWYVQDGEVELTVGARSETTRRDGFAYVPEHTTHAVKNQSTKPARLFLWNSPAGAERAFAAAHRLATEQPGLPAEAYLRALAPFGYRFHGVGENLPNDALTNSAVPRMEAWIDSFQDYTTLRRRWGERTPVPKLVHDRRTCHDIAMKGQDTKVLLSGDEGSGRAVVFHYGIEPGYAAPPHHQPSEEEIFLIIEGALQLTAGNVTTCLPKGGFGFVPRYATHGFQNATSAETRTITINSPAGHERGFEMIVREAGSDRFGDLLEAHGWQVHEAYEPG